MNKDYPAVIASALQNIADGSFIITACPLADEQPGTLTRQLHTQITGRGKMTVCQLFAGASISFSQFAASRAAVQHDSSSAVLNISYCRSGRIGWTMQDGSVYLGSGDIALHPMTCCANSAMTFPLGYYEGVTISADLAILSANPPPLLQDGGFEAGLLYERFCAAPKPAVILANREIDRIFPALYDLPDAQQHAYYKLKTQELLLYLSRLTPDTLPHLPYSAEQTAIIREIHQYITGNLPQRFTIEELARKYLINSSSLKTVFKAVYGQPIATYMKEYRIRQAMNLLTETQSSIAAVAASVGYETQSKFTQAFKDITHMLPSEYRRRSK